MGCAPVWTTLPIFLTYRTWQEVDSTPGSALPLFSFITHTGPLEVFGKCHRKCRTWLFLARTRPFTLISCFSASASFFFPPYFVPHLANLSSLNVNFLFAAFPRPGRFPTRGGLRGAAPGCPAAWAPQRAHAALQESGARDRHLGPPRPARPLPALRAGFRPRRPSSAALTPRPRGHRGNAGPHGLPPPPPAPESRRSAPPGAEAGREGPPGRA